MNRQVTRLDAAVIQRGASELFDRLYDVFGGKFWPLAELNVATAAFFDLVFKSTLLECSSGGDEALEEARGIVVQLLERLTAEIRQADRAQLVRARELYLHLRDPR